MMLKNSESLTEFAREHRTVFEKICDAVFEFIEKIRGVIASLYGNETAKNPEAQFMELYADELQKIFDKALSDALNASEATVDHNLPKNEKTAGEGGRVQYEKLENVIDVNKTLYPNVIKLEYKTFKRIARRGKDYIDFIRNNLIDKKITVYDNQNVPEIIEFAKSNERVKKGNGSFRRVLGELEQVRNELKKLVIVNAVETAEISKLAKSSPPDGHQWLDENGWTERTSYVMNNEGIIFPVTLFIAKTSDGRNILYDLNVKIKEGVAIDKIATSQYRTEQAVKLASPSEDSIPDSTEKSNSKVQKSAAEVPAYASMPEFYTPIEGEYGYQREGYTAENGLKLFTKYSVDSARDFIMSELILTEGKTELARDLNEFYTFMATAEKLTWEDIEKRAGEIADRHLSKRSERVNRDPRAQEALDTIRGTRISLDEKQRADAKAYSGSFGKYRQSLMGRVNITRDGIPLDSIWQEWAEEFPQYFPSQKCHFRPFHCCFDQNIHKNLVIFVYKQY